MPTSGPSRWTIACVGALVLGYAASVSAQDTTRARRDSAKQRVARGEVVLSRDSAAEHASAEQLRLKQLRTGNPLTATGWYFGIAGGGSAPLGDVKDLGYDNGFNVTVPLGWHRIEYPLGFRLDLSYNQLNGGTNALGLTGSNPDSLPTPDPKIYSATLNTTLRLPLSPSRMTAFYLIGGGGVYFIRNFGRGSPMSGYLGNDIEHPADTTNVRRFRRFGYNAGAGLELGIGTSSLFIESRYINVLADRGENPSFDSRYGKRGNSVRWVPIVLGIAIR